MDDGRDPRGAWIWIAIGCGGFALSLLCIVPPALWFARDASDERVQSPVVPPGPLPVAPSPAPTPPVAPGPPSPPLPSPPPPGPESPRRITAVIEHASGSIAAHPGSECTFEVSRVERPDGTFWCNAQVRCSGELLYGGPSAGYFDCTLYDRPERHVVGEDDLTSAQDGDAAMRLDTLRRELHVRDDASGPRGAFSMRARVTSVQ